MRLSLDDATQQLAQPRHRSSITEPQTQPPGTPIPRPASRPPTSRPASRPPSSQPASRPPTSRPPEEPRRRPPVEAPPPLAPVEARTDAEPPAALRDRPIGSAGLGASSQPPWSEVSDWSYEPIAELTRSQDSVTFSARERRTGRRVLLKVFDAGRVFDPRLPIPYWLWLFERESTIASRIDHAMLPRLLGAEKVRDAFAIAYEEVSTEPLRERLPSPNRPDLPRLFADIAEGLQGVHDRGFLHCNPSLDNVHLKKDGRPYLPDLSFAIPRQGPLHPLLVTHLPSNSPELAAYGRHEACSDQFLLGMALYEALSGKPPFGSDSHTIERVLHQATPPLGGHVGPALNTVLMRMLDKDPTHRFGTCAEVARALRAIR